MFPIFIDFNSLRNASKRDWLIAFAGVIVLMIVAYFAWQHFHSTQPVTALSQQQAETPAGIELATKNAQIRMLQSLLEEAAKQIAELKNRPPDTVIKTVPVEVPKIIEVERKKSGADFAIVTDPNQPDKPVGLKQVQQLPANTPVTLNQYNVHVYKKIIRGVNVYPDWGELAQGNFKIAEITGDISKRITRDGKYLGITGGYDFKYNQAKLGLRVTF